MLSSKQAWSIMIDGICKQSLRLTSHSTLELHGDPASKPTLITPPAFNDHRRAEEVAPTGNRCDARETQ